NTEPDLIDGLVGQALRPGAGTVTDFVKVLKDRILGDPSLTDPGEITLLQGLFGASLDADASTVPGFDDSLRRLCGMLLGAPQFLMLGLQPAGGDVPALTPTTSSYDAVCEDLATRPLPDGLGVTCAGGKPLTVSVLTPP